MAGPMRWKSRQMARELENYRARVAAERASQEAGTDLDADAIRLGAPDIVPVVGTAALGHGGESPPARRPAPRAAAAADTSWNRADGPFRPPD